MKNKPYNFSVLVNLTQGSEETGTLEYTSKGPIITLDNGQTIIDQNNVFFRLKEIYTELPLTSDDIVKLKPSICVNLGYSTKQAIFDTMYPRSTDSWISHVIESEYQALFVVQEIKGLDRKLLTITNMDEINPFSAHRVHPYETSILHLKRDWLVQKKIHLAQTDVFSLLDTNPPTWESVGKLVDGVNIPNLAIKSSMGETLDQLVPRSFPQEVRKQIITFLAWLDKASFPEEDPLDFLQKFASVMVLRSLVTGHLKCLLDDVEHPPYVRIMAQADAGQLKLTERPTFIAIEQNPWYSAQLKLYELFPDWTNRVFELTNSLNTGGKIITEFPVTRNQSAKSKKCWSDRFALATQGLIIRGYVHRESIGLKTLVYIGAAHKWPHTHLEFSARLGYQADKSSQIQIMVMPQTAVDRVIRIMPSVNPIDWETNSINLSLYNDKKGRWNINKSTILKSLERTRSLRQLENEFGKWVGKTQVQLTHEEARILDLLSWGMYLQNLEYNRYSKYYGIERHTIKETIDELQQKGVFKLFYLVAMQKLTSLCISAKGPSTNVCSLARSFLKHAPTADVRLANQGSACFIITRVPEDDAFNLLTSLPTKAQENGVNLTAYPISAYIGYRNNLYHRLRKDDGTWDDDVSGLLSQVRLRPKDDE